MLSYSRLVPLKECLILAASLVVTLLITSRIESSEITHELLHKHEWLCVDRFMACLVVVFVVHTVLAFRRGKELERSVEERTRELGKEVGRRRDSEKAFRDAQLRLLTVLDSIPDLLWLKDREGRYILTNEAFAKACGRKPGDLIGLTDTDIWPSEVADLYRKNDTDVMESDYCLRIDEPLPAGTGKREWIEAVKAPIYDETGEINGVLGIARNVTERKIAEDALRHSERRYRELADLLPQTVFEVDTRGRNIFSNRAAYSMFGYEENELGLQMDVLQRLAPEDRQRAQENLGRRLNGEELGYQEYVALKKDGTRFPIKIYSSVIYEGEKVVGLRGLLIDITEQRKAEEALRQAKDMLQALIDASPVGINAMDENGNVLMWNPASEKILGWSAEEVIGKLHPAIFAETREELMEIIKGAFTGRGVRQKEVLRRRKDGSLAVVSLSTAPVHDSSGRIIAAMGMFFDLTEQKKDAEERKKLEEQLRQSQKIEAIGTLAGGIAHDFNNILATILGYTDLALLQLPAESPVKQDLEQVLRATGRARDLVKQILIFSRQTRLQERSPIEIGPVIEDAVKFARATLPATVEIRHNLPMCSLTVKADVTQIHQVMLNLCTNAAHAMEQSGGTLEIGLEETEIGHIQSVEDGLAPGPYLRLTVSDTGHGMDSATMERIFDPYFTTKEVGKGTGLGLAVVHGIVKRHEGSISVRSEPGKGSTFEVLLPLVGSNPRQELPKCVPLSKGAGRVLYVDDEPVIVDVGTRILESLGYEAVGVTGSIEALEIFRATPERFDIVITDYTMPYMTGEAFAEAILRIRPDIPILLATGFSERISAEKAREIGIREFVMKPLSIRDLAEAVKRAMNRGR